MAVYTFIVDVLFKDPMSKGKNLTAVSLTQDRDLGLKISLVRSFASVLITTLAVRDRKAIIVETEERFIIPN